MREERAESGAVPWRRVRVYVYVCGRVWGACSLARRAFKSGVSFDSSVVCLRATPLPCECVSASGDLYGVHDDDAAHVVFLQ